jgi:hypothetical protein
MLFSQSMQKVYWLSDTSEIADTIGVCSLHTVVSIVITWPPFLNNFLYVRNKRIRTLGRYCLQDAHGFVSNSLRSFYFHVVNSSEFLSLSRTFLDFLYTVSLAGGSDKLRGAKRTLWTLWLRTHVTYIMWISLWITFFEPCEAHHIQDTACRLDFWRYLWYPYRYTIK